MRKITVIEPKKSTAVRKVRVAAYCRVSTEKSDQANSYETQKTYFMNSYIKAANEEIVEIYADLGSGTSELYRPEFMRMINDCRLGKVDRIQLIGVILAKAVNQTKLYKSVRKLVSIVA